MDFACFACRVHFDGLSAQRSHYQSQWHRYNLKRNVAQLPPVTLEAFQQLEALQKESQEPQRSKSSFYCDVCCKIFGNENAFKQHVQSKKHVDVKTKRNANQDSVKKSTLSGAPADRRTDKPVDLVKPAETAMNAVSCDEVDESDSDWEDVDEEGTAIPTTECLFCSYCSDSLQNNIEHMSSKHSFFIPDVDYLQDIEGLLSYLGEKVGDGFRCLWCGDSGRSFRNVQAVRRHMLDKGHCKMKFEIGESLLEYSDFYDYSASYPDAELADKNEEVEVNEIVQTDDWQLVLPSGATIGHRSLMKYYKQNLKPISQNGANVRPSIMDKVMSNYRALGWTGTTGEAAVRKAKDIKCFQRIRAKESLRIMQKHNKLLQPHFRSQIGF